MLLGCASAAGPAALRTVTSTPPAPSVAATRFLRVFPITSPIHGYRRAGPRSHLDVRRDRDIGSRGKSGVVGEHDLAGRGRVAVLRLPGDGDDGIVGQADRRPQLDGARAAAHVEGADGDQPARPLHPGLVVVAPRGGRQSRDVQLDGQPGGRGVQLRGRARGRGQPRTRQDDVGGRGPASDHEGDHDGGGRQQCGGTGPDRSAHMGPAAVPACRGPGTATGRWPPPPGPLTVDTGQELVERPAGGSAQLSGSARRA